MGDANPIRTLGDYSKPRHEGYRNTIGLPVGNNVVPLRSDTIRFMIDELISHEESAFIKGRQILDGPLILNEIVSWCQSRKEKYLLFKINFQKALDSVR
ncbi:hypothetical protein Tco_0484711 [Tanacetum coccineum]